MSVILEVNQISKSYGGFAVEDISFDLEEGTIAGLVGRNGAGKSTIIRSVLGLTKIDSGEVRIDGMLSRPFGEHLNQIGYVPDRPVYYDWMTVDEAIRFISRFYRVFDLELAGNLKAEFELRGDKKIKALSAGMRTKLALILALAHQPRLLILDEPTSGLDPIFREDLLEHLASLRSRRSDLSILFSSHILSDVDRIADKIIIIRKGRLAGIYKAGDLLNSWSLLVSDRAIEIPGAASVKDWKTKAALGRVGFCILNQELDATLARLSESDRRCIRVENPTTEEVLMGLI